MRDSVRVHQREAHRGHAAGRVAQDRDSVHAQVIEQGCGIRRQQLEAVMKIGLGRLPPADLVRRDDPVTGPGQGLDDVAEVVTAERLPWNRTTASPLGSLAGGMSM